jgi:hypothetical protein
MLGWVDRECIERRERMLLSCMVFSFVLVRNGKGWERGVVLFFSLLSSVSFIHVLVHCFFFSAMIRMDVLICFV